MRKNQSPYVRARLYDIAFSFRDYGLEADASERWYDEITGGRPGNVLELAAGPARHAMEFARRGTEAWALDLEPSMVRYARRESRRQGLHLNAVQGDMISFDLGRRFDLALLMMTSNSHIVSARDMVRHLRCVARHLNPGGVFVVEMALPDEPGSDPHALSRWTQELDGVSVEAIWGCPDDPVDNRRKVSKVTIELRSVSGSFVSTIDMREWKRREFEACVARSGLYDEVRCHGAFEPGAKPWRVIQVMRRSLVSEC